MKLVIDIDEDIYRARQCWVANPKRMIDEVDIAIANGTPLPKGHGRLIDAEVFAHNVVKYSHQSTKTIGQALADTPSIVEADKGEQE